MTEDVLRKALASPDPEERRAAAGRIASVEAPGRIDLLLQALADADWRVRKEATAAAAGLAPSPDVVRSLVSVLGSGDNVGLRNATVEALGYYGASAVDALAAEIPRLDADGRKLAAEALSRSGDPGALAVLASLLDDPDANVRAAAIEAVGLVGAGAADRASGLLRRCLAAPDELEILTALEAINRLGVVVPWSSIERFVARPVLQKAAWVAAGIGGHIEAIAPLVWALDRERGEGWAVATVALATLLTRNQEAGAAVRSGMTSLGDVGRARLCRAAESSERLDLRRSALLLVGALGTTEAAAIAVAALRDDRVAAEADGALVMLGPAAILALAARVRDGEADERVACVDLLSRLADDSTIATARQVIVDATHDAAPEVAVAALGALERVGDASSLGLIARWVGPGVPSAVRHAAAAALGVCARKFPVEAHRLAEHQRTDASKAAVIAVVIGATGERVFGSVEADVEFLAVAVSNESPAVRRAAVDALATIPSASAVEPVAFALADEAAEVQEAAARALGKMRDPSGRAIGVSRLLEVVRSSQDDGLTVAAVEALGDTGDISAIEVLRHLVNEGGAMVAVAAVGAMGRLEGPGRLEALLETLAHPEPEVVKAALRAMAADRDPRVDAHLGACLDHPAWDVRRLSADLFGRRGGETAKRLLRQRLASETEPLVKDALQRSLSELEEVVAGGRTVPPPNFGGSEG